MEPFRLTEVDFDRIAESNDLHLVQALRVTASDLDRRDVREGEAARLRDEVTSLLGAITTTSRDAGRQEAEGDRFQRFYLDDQEVVDTARAALMAYADRPDDETAGLAADAIAALAEQH